MRCERSMKEGKREMTEDKREREELASRDLKEWGEGRKEGSRGLERRGRKLVIRPRSQKPVGVDIHADTLDDGTKFSHGGDLEACGGFGGPCFVCVVEEGFPVIADDLTGWGDGYGGVVCGNQ